LNRNGVGVGPVVGQDQRPVGEGRRHRRCQAVFKAFQPENGFLQDRSTPVAPRGVAIIPDGRVDLIFRTAQPGGVLRIRPVDATRGDIDPTLRLDLLERLQKVPQAKVTRSLFELQAVAPCVSYTHLTLPTINYV